MIFSRTLVTLVALSMISPTFAATVSGEIGSRPTTSTRISTVKVPVKKVVIKNLTRTVTYMSPAGKESIIFSIKTRDRIIVFASAIPKTKNKISLALQREFAKKLSKAVVGKKIQ